MELFGAILVLVIGAAFAVLGYGARNAARRRAGRGTVTEGVVVGSSWEGTGAPAGPVRYAAPEVEFVDRDGETRRFTHPAGTNVRPEAGRRVEVWYDPDDPATEPVIHGEAVSTMLPILFMGIGAVAVVVGAAMLRAAVG